VTKWYLEVGLDPQLVYELEREAEETGHEVDDLVAEALGQRRKD
jgi:hypothetical protein